MNEQDTQDLEAGQALFQEKLSGIYAEVLKQNPVSAASQNSDAAKSRV